LTMRFVKKPIVIEAMQFNNDVKGYDILQWANNAQAERGAPFISWKNDKMYIPTLEGVMTASPGDWIIRGIAGEFYPCKPAIFDATYEPCKDKNE